MDVPLMEAHDISATVRLLVSVIWFLSAGTYLYAYKNERLTFLRPMRRFAFVLSLLWAFSYLYTGLAFYMHWPFPEFVEMGLLSVVLIIPTAAYFISSAWVTHRIVRSWE